MTGNEFQRRLENVGTERVTATSGVEVARQYAAVLADEITRIFIRAGATDRALNESRARSNRH